MCVDDVNKDLPDDIRLLALKQTTPKFDARTYCNARTYSYTLPTIAFGHYTDQTSLEHFRVTPSQMQRANEILSLYKGNTNFHNYAPHKLYYDRSSKRRIDSIEIIEPFVERGLELCRIVIKGESFMMHQIRRMIGFALAVIRGVVSDDMMQRSFTKEIFNAPTAPGLGLVLERLHYPQYARAHPAHDPLTFDEFDDAIEQFRREKIHPNIVETEMRDRSMLQWLDILGIHMYDAASKTREENRQYHNDEEFGEEWGENPEFIEKLRQYRERNC